MENNFGVILYSNGNTQFSNSYFASTIAERQFMGNCGKISSAKQSAKVKQLKAKTSSLTKQASSGQSKETAGRQEQGLTQKTPLPCEQKEQPSVRRQMNVVMKCGHKRWNRESFFKRNENWGDGCE